MDNGTTQTEKPMTNEKTKELAAGRLLRILTGDLKLDAEEADRQYEECKKIIMGGN